jgi:hypothetical protein
LKTTTLLYFRKITKIDENCPDKALKAEKRDCQI